MGYGSGYGSNGVPGSDPYPKALTESHMYTYIYISIFPEQKPTSILNIALR